MSAKTFKGAGQQFHHRPVDPKNYAEHTARDSRKHRSQADQRPLEKADQEEGLSPEEERYLETYRQEIEALEEAGDKTLARRLTEVVEEAVKLQRGEVFLGDLIQEGNMRLVMLLEEDPEKEEEARRVTVRSAMEEFIASSGEVRRRDRQMVRKVTDLNNTVKAMEEEEGRKVTLDEAAGRLGITRQEAEQIWKLTSEEEA